MKTRISVLMLVLGCLLVMSVYAAQKGPKEEVAASRPAGEAIIQKAVSLKTESDKVSYVIGAQLAQNFRTRGIEITIEPLMWGLRDAMAGKELALSQDEMRQVMTGLQLRIREKQAAKR
ncbi:MAG: FKBP-type peptidyl-prolyl cis-trans isomerase N-terminal domain-containing protein, partial [Phycisphaerales bacterium]